MLNKEKVGLIKALKKLDKNGLTHVISHFDKEGIDKVCECVFNTIFTDLKISKRRRRKIKSVLNNDKSKNNIKIITKGRGNYLKRKAAILQEGEGIGLILSALAPLVTSLFTGK